MQDIRGRLQHHRLCKHFFIHIGSETIVQPATPPDAILQEGVCPTSFMCVRLLLAIWSKMFRAVVPLEETSESHSRKLKQKRTTSTMAAPISGPPPQAPLTKQRGQRGQPRHTRTPKAFFDNLSRQWLTSRTLREFDRRTIRPIAPIPPDRSNLKKSHCVKLKRFALHGGPSLRDLRGVGSADSSWRISG